MTVRLLLRLFATVLLPLLAGCAGLGSPPPPPRVVVVIVVDGLPQRLLLQMRGQLAPDGFARFLDRGAWFAEAHFAHASTVTASGHATLFTGAWPRRHGIIGNSWRDPASGTELASGGDAQARFLGAPTRAGDSTSPRNLLAETLGDAMRRQDPRARVVAVAGKDRSAVLPGGRRGTAFLFHDDTGVFVSSSYYMDAYPAWRDAFHAARPPSPAADPATRDTLALDFATAALAGERLGADGVPDLLAVSLSGLDLVHHQHGPGSPASRAHLLHADRALQDFLRGLDAALGADGYLAVLTSDHGFMETPGPGGGRIATRQLVAQVNADLQRRFGVARLVAYASASALVLDRALLAAHGLDAEAVAQAARASLVAMPGIAAAYTRGELLARSRADAPWFEAVHRSWHPVRSGDVPYVLQPGWMPGQATATHGSPHRYDTHVPLMYWGPRWIRAGRVDTPAEMVDLAPTLARMVGAPTPAQAEGRVLRTP